MLYLSTSCFVLLLLLFIFPLVMLVSDMNSIVTVGLDELRETVEKLKLQVAESTRQESLLVMRLAAKEQEVQELLVSEQCSAHCWCG